VKDPEVCVVVPTYQRSRLLARTIEALAELDPPDGGFEVVVVDDGSGDEHRAAAGAAIAGRPAFRLLCRPNGGPAAARNAGIASSQSALVAFLDDDCAPARDWLVRLVACLADGGEEVGAVGGRVRPAPPTNWVSRFCAATEYSSGIQPVFENAATANACFRRRVLDELGGFDEGFRHPGGDDPDLSRRARAAGYRVVFAPDAVVYHAELESYRDFVAHMYRRGIGEARLGRKSGGAGRVLLRAVLLPVYLIRTGAICWHATAGKGGLATRIAWLGLASVGGTAFVGGSVYGLAARA
jgi:GT2 family glycosyltransferase